MQWQEDREKENSEAGEALGLAQGSRARAGRRHTPDCRTVPTKGALGASGGSSGSAPGLWSPRKKLEKMWARPRVGDVGGTGQV